MLQKKLLLNYLKPDEYKEQSLGLFLMENIQKHVVGYT